MKTKLCFLLFTVCSAFAEENQEVALKSDELHWSQSQHLFKLNPHAELSIKGMGNLICDGEVQICHNQHAESQQIEWLKSIGKTELTIIDPENNKNVLTCTGEVYIDAVGLVMTLEGTKGTQILFENEQTRITADRAHATYKEIEGKTCLEELYIEGHVKISNLAKRQEMHHCLSDQVSYLPQNALLILSAEEGNRVLLYDLTHDVKMSAPAIRITRDPTTQKQTYSGIGDVRLTFSEQELHHFKENFSINEKQDASKTATNMP